MQKKKIIVAGENPVLWKKDFPNYSKATSFILLFFFFLIWVIHSAKFWQAANLFGLFFKLYWKTLTTA